MTPRSLFVVMVAAPGLMLAGCGGGDDRLTREEFIDQANAICSEGNERLEAAQEEIVGDTQGAPTDEQLQQFFDIIVPEIQSQLDDIGDLNPPEDLQDDVDALLEEGQSALDDVEEQGPDALLGEDPFAQANEMAGDLGLTACAE